MVNAGNGTELKSKSIYSLLWKLLERSGYAVVQMAVQVVMARLLGPNEFGALAIMLVFVNVGNVIVQSGLNTALIQADSVDEGSYSTVFWMSLTVSVILYAVCFIGAPFIADFYKMPMIVWPLRVLCLLLIVNAYNAVQIAKITRDLDMRKTFVSTIFSVITSGIIGTGAALAGFGLWALVAQQLTYQIANCAVLALQVDWHPTCTFRFTEAQNLFSFGWKLLVSGLLNTGYNSLSDLIVGAQFSASALGIMSQGKKYPTAIGSMLDGSIQPVMLSAVSHVSSDKKRAHSLTRRALKSSCYLVMPAMALFACASNTLVPLLLGERWRSAIPYMQVFCITNAFLPIHTTNLQSLNAMGRSDLFLKLEVIKKLYGVATLLFCAFILKDVWLLCCSYLITSVVSQVINSWPNREVLGYSYADQLRDIAPGALLSLMASAMALGVMIIPLPPIAMLTLQVIVFVAVYVGLSALFRVESFRYLLSTARGVIGH